MAERKEYKFQFMPLEGRLPGLMLERQIEDAINDLGIWLVDVSSESEASSELAQQAYAKAAEAGAAASAAQTAAEKAGETAEESRLLAESAQNTAAEAQSAASDALQTANEAKAAAQTATETANEASAGAKEATDTATDAAEAAEMAQQSATNAVETANQALLAAEDGKIYICIGFPEEEDEDDEAAGETEPGPEETADLDDYIEFGKYHTAAGVLNTPTDDAEYFVDVDINDQGDTVRQKADKKDSGDTYTRWGKLSTEEDDEGEEITVVEWGRWHEATGGGSEIEPIPDDFINSLFS